MLRCFFEVTNLLWSRPPLCAGCARTAIDIFARRKSCIRMSIVRRSGKIIASYEITVDSGETHNEVSRELRLRLPREAFPRGDRNRYGFGESGRVWASHEDEFVEYEAVSYSLTSKNECKIIYTYTEICLFPFPIFIPVHAFLRHFATRRNDSSIDNNSMCLFLFYRRARAVLRSF